VKTAVETKMAPSAVGPYSQAVCSGDFVFVSGQLGVDPKTKELCSSSIEGEVARALDNLRAVLEAAGSSLDAVVKTTVYVTDIGEFGKVNAVYGGYFKSPAPARATVQVAALPLGARVEIDAIARASQA